MSLLIGSTSTQGEETTNYRLRLYVDENYNPQGDGGNLIFKTRINVYGKVAMTGEPVMKNTGYKTYLAGEFVYINTFNDYGDYALDFEKVTSIIVKNNILVPTTALTTWDLSEAQDKSVIAYINEDNLESIGNNETSYEIVIGGQGGVIAPEDSEYLFAGGYYRNLKRLNLQYLDTSRVTNMNAMFGGVRANKLYLSNFNTSKVTNMSDMFCDCQNLTELNISNFDTSKVTDMSSMFFGCSGLTSLDLTSFDTLNVTNMSDMFARCNHLSNLDVSNFDTSNVTNMNHMFSNCINLTSLGISNFNTTNVMYMIGMFKYCSSLTSLNLTSLDTSKVTDMSSMFSDCSGLTSLDLTSFDTSAIDKSSAIGGTAQMFWNCTNLTSILVSSRWDKMNAYYMFQNCGTDHVTIVG